MIYNSLELTRKAKALFEYERSKNRLDGWFIAKETEYQCEIKYKGLGEELKKAYILKELAKSLPLEITENHVFVGSQNDGFARSYALINPKFKVEEFTGYCKPTAVFNDIEPNNEFTIERIQAVKTKMEETTYIKELSEIYTKSECYTKEVVFFVEQVTGHLVPDFKKILSTGVMELLDKLKSRTGNGYAAMSISLEAVLILANRYKELAQKQLLTACAARRQELQLIIDTLNKVPAYGASNLFEAIQFYILLWQVMCIEQTPNPYAFSVGNADRIFEPYRKDTNREIAKGLFEHFLVFFNVGDRSWAISQNIIVSGRDANGNDLTNETTYALLDAFYEMNIPQPILSVKLHQNTPDKLYRELGKFFFSAGVLTPSLFNDDSLFAVFSKAGYDQSDLQDIAIAGCQEPLIMGKDNANTTNSWLNLAKILELTLNNGVSGITGEQIADLPVCNLSNIRECFYKNAEMFINEMVSAANKVSVALSNLRVPFLSCFMGGAETGIDTRDCTKQGTKYNGSGCLIHGLSIVADSFIAIDSLLKERPQDKERLHSALLTNFENDNELREYLLSCPKYGNNIADVDNEIVKIASKIADIITSKKNYLGNAFRPDFSSPSTHLLYGYWVGATPDGRKARQMLGYGIDPLYGEAGNGLGFRMLSSMRLPFEKMNGGYASHLGIDPKYFKAENMADKGIEFKEKVINPLFFNPLNDKISPFYLYVNVTTPQILRKVLSDPKKYAPNGVYIVRIHGTFVNFLDLSPDIQEDIIRRLDLKSTKI